MNSVGAKLTQDVRHGPIDPFTVIYMACIAFLIFMAATLIMRTMFGWVNPFGPAGTKAFGEVNYARRYCPAVASIAAEAVADGNLSNLEARRVGRAYHRIRASEALLAARNGSTDPWADVRCGTHAGGDGSTYSNPVFVFEGGQLTP